MKEKIKNNKIVCIIGILVFVGLLVLLIFIIFNDSKTDLKVNYNDGKEISQKNFTKKFEIKKEFVVTNKTDKEKKYDIVWKNTTNTLKEQNKFLYKIDCEGPNCQTLGESQVPVTDAPVITDITIKPNQKQKYTAIFYYKGSEKNVDFDGELIISYKK